MGVLQITHSLSPARQFFEVANFGTVPSPSSDAIPRRERRHDGVGKVGDLSGIGYVRERREQNKLGACRMEDENFHPFMIRQDLLKWARRRRRTWRENEETLMVSLYIIINERVD